MRALGSGRGRDLCLHGILVGGQGPLGPVHLAVGWPLQACAWPTAVGRWPLNSVLRDPQALDRLGLVLAAATLFLVAQGVEVVEQQARRQVDPHWDRGLSYLKIGWRYVKRSLVHPTLTLIQRLLLPPGPDPCPAIASRAQAERNKQTTHFFHCRIVYSTSFVSQ